MYETWERPKAIINSRHMLDVQHRIDSEYQVLNKASLRRKEHERELIEKKREQQISKQKRRWLTLSSIYSTRSYERPWASGMGTNTQVSVAGLSEARLHPNSKKPAAKLPAIASTVDRNKLKPTSILKNKGLSLDSVNPAIQPQILSKRTRLHQRKLPERATLPRAQGPASSLPEKTPGPEAPGLGGSKVLFGNSDSVSRNTYGKKTTSHFSQPNRDVKACEETTRSRGGVLQLLNSTAPSSSPTGSRAANDSSLVQSSRPSRAPPNSSVANGSSSSPLSGPTKESPRTSVFNSSFQTRTSGTPQASPSTFEANRSPWSPVSRSSHAPPRSPETSRASESQLNEPACAPRSSSEISGFPLSLSSRQSHAPPSATDANLSPSIQLRGQPYTPPQSMESRISLFRFQEEDFYRSLNSAIASEDTTDTYLLADDDNLSVGSPTRPSSSNGNSRPFQTPFSQVTSSDAGRSRQNSVHVGEGRAELYNGASTQFNMAPISEPHAAPGHEGERSWRSPRTDDVESHRFGPPVTSVSRFNCGEGSAIGVGDNGRRHENGRNESPNSIGISPASSTNGAQGRHSAFRNPRSSTPSPPTEVAPLTRFVDSYLEAADTDANSRPSASRRPLSPIRSRFSFTSTRNPDPLLDTSVASEFVTQRQGRNGGSRFESSFPMAPSHRNYEDVPTDSEASLSTSYPHSLHLNLPQESPARSALQENLPLALLAVSDLHPQAAGVLNRISLLPPAAEKEASKPKADPEKLRRLKESLLEEDSEEEGDLCRICLISGGTADNPLLEPCRCGGSLQFVHKECLTKWLKAKITSGAQLEAVKRCELCRQNLHCDLGEFNLDDFYSAHQQSQGQSELMNSGLYLMLLLHLYEQRYAELLRLTHSRARRDMNSSEYIPVAELSTFRALFRNYRQLRAEANENAESGDSGEESEQTSPSSTA